MIRREMDHVLSAQQGELDAASAYAPFILEYPSGQRPTVSLFANEKDSHFFERLSIMGSGYTLVNY